LKNSPILHKVINFIKNKNLLNIGDNCLLAVSGGFDSTVLTSIIFQIKNLFKIDISIVHINYNLREQDSINDRIYVGTLAKKYNIKMYLLDINLNSYINSLDKKDSLENIARNIRYDFFEKTAKENNFNKIVLAHNSNDNAETVLLKLIRGTVSGLKGIEAKRFFSNTNNIEIVRPLLILSRSEIEFYAKQNNLEPRQDFSNFGNEYTRNRIRNNFLPLILNENPNFLESINQLTDVFSHEDRFLDKLSNQIIDECLVSISENEIILSYKKLITYQEEILGRVIKNTFFRLRIDRKSFSYKHIEAIKNNLKKNISNKLIELPDNYTFIKKQDNLVFKNFIY